MQILTEPLSQPTCLTAIRDGQLSGWWWADDLALVELVGGDAGDFLQRRTSNDVAALAVGQGQANTVLERKAELRALFTLHRVAVDCWWLVTEVSRVEALVREINRFKIMEQFQLKVLSEFKPLCMLGSSWSRSHPDFQEKPQHSIEPALNDIVNDKCWLTHRPLVPFGRQPGASWIVWVPQETQAAAQTWLNGIGSTSPTQEVSLAKQETLQLEAALPRFGQDWDETTTLPELGLETEAVSYTKGCYLGQETVAKVRTYGAISQLWMGLRFNVADANRLAHLPLAEPGSLGHPLLIDQKKMGRLTSWGWSPSLRQPLGLAYLGKGVRAPGQELAVDIAGQAFMVTVEQLPLSLEGQPTASHRAQQLAQTAMTHFVADDSETAITLLNEALQLDPTLESALESLGVILRRLDRVKEAEAVFHRLLALNPEAIMAYTNLSVLALTHGDKEAAETWKAQGTTVAMRVKIRETMAAKAATSTMDTATAPSVAAAPAIAPTLTDEQETLLHERIALFQQALQFNETDPLAHAGLAGAWMSLNQPDNAIPSLRRALELQSGNLKAYVQLGHALAATDQSDAARAVYEQGIERATIKGDTANLAALRQGLVALG